MRHLRSTIVLVTFLILAAGSSNTDRSSKDAADAPASSATVGRSTAEDVRVTAAALFTSRFASSGLAAWNIRGQAAGQDCGVLLVTIGAVMDDSMIESLHLSSDVYEGGVEHFYHERSFRGVVYRDASGQFWRYGIVARDEAKSLGPC